jgi:hypothetical protein
LTRSLYVLHSWEATRAVILPLHGDGEENMMSMSQSGNGSGNGSSGRQEGERSNGVAVDLQKLEQHAKSLYLHRFVESIKAARSTHGQFLVLRAGDEIAIKAADDGSEELLEAVAVEADEE